MLNKVSQEEKINYLDSAEPAIDRKTPYQSAADSFANVIKKQVQAKLASGLTLAQAGQQLGLSPDIIEVVMQEPAQEQKVASASNDTTDDYLDRAEAANNTLYNRKKANLDEIEQVILPKGIQQTSERAREEAPVMTSVRNKNQNSIFDPNVIERKASEKSNDEKTREEKEAMAQAKADANVSGNQLISEKDLERALSESKKVASGSYPVESTNYSNRIPQGAISIFDTDFNKIPELTPGEKAVLEKKASRVKQAHNYEESSRTLKTSDIFARMVDSMLDGTKKDSE